MDDRGQLEDTKQETIGGRWGEARMLSHVHRDASSGVFRVLNDVAVLILPLDVPAKESKLC